LVRIPALITYNRDCAIGGGKGGSPGEREEGKKKKKRGGDKNPIGGFHAKNRRTPPLGCRTL
jgi:hypothetical protein